MLVLWEVVQIPLPNLNRAPALLKACSPTFLPRLKIQDWPAGQNSGRPSVEIPRNPTHPPSHMWHQER